MKKKKILLGALLITVCMLPMSHLKAADSKITLSVVNTFNDMKIVYNEDGSVKAVANDMSYYRYKYANNQVSRIDNFSYSNHHFSDSTLVSSSVFTYKGNNLTNLKKETKDGVTNTTFTYNAQNKLMSVSDQNGTYSFKYNKANQISNETQKTGNKSLLSNDYTYDSKGNIATITDHDLSTGKAVKITLVNKYDKEGNLTSENIKGFGATTTITYKKIQVQASRKSAITTQQSLFFKNTVPKRVYLLFEPIFSNTPE
jgi:YD repeat-containing protein